MRTMFYSLEVSAFIKFEYFKVIDFLTSLIGDNGSTSFWDWKTGYQYQSLDTTAQPGSLDAEAGLMSSTFDKTGLRLICGEADKTSKECLSQQEPR